MQVGTDDSVVALSFDENSTGKTFADTKVRYTWEVSVDGKVHRIEFTNTKTSGKKRIFVDGRLLHEMTVFRSPNFQYSWPIGGHLLSIVPVKADGTDSIFDKVMDRMANSVDCQFELRINGLPFRAFRKQPSRVVPVRPSMRPIAAEPPQVHIEPDREYLEMCAKVQELQSREKASRPHGIEASPATSGRKSSPWEAAAPRRESKGREATRMDAPGDPWKGSGASAPGRRTSQPEPSGGKPRKEPRLEEGEDVGFTTGSGKYASFPTSPGSSSEEDEGAFTSYGTTTAAPEPWPAPHGSSLPSSWPDATSKTGAWPSESWEAAPASAQVLEPPIRRQRPPVPSYAIPWSPVPSPPQDAMPQPAAASISSHRPTKEAMTPSSPATPQVLIPVAPPAGQRSAALLARRKALLESIGLGTAFAGGKLPQAPGSFQWPEASQRPRPVAQTRPHSKELLAQRQALLETIGLGRSGERSETLVWAETEAFSPSPCVQGAVVDSHSLEQENEFLNTFPVVQGTVVDVEERADTGVPIQWPELHSEVKPLTEWPSDRTTEETSLESSTPFQWPGLDQSQVKAFSSTTGSPSGASPNKETAPSWPVSSQAVETGAGAAKTFDPWPSTPVQVSASWPSQEPESLPQSAKLQPIPHEVSPSLSPPAQAVETAASAAKTFDPWPSTPVSASWPSQEPERLPEPEKIPPKEPREVAPQVSSEVSPSISPPAQAVETAAGAAKAFDPWPSTPVSASWPSQEIQDSAEQAERAIQWPSVEVPPAPEAQEITQTLLEEPEKPQPITLEVAPQVSSEVSPSLSSPPAQAVETPAGAAKAFDPWPSTPVSTSWPSQEIQDSAEQAERAIQWPSVEVPPTPEAQEITQTQLEEPEKPQPITLEVAPQVSSEVSPSFPPPAQVSKVEDEAVATAAGAAKAFDPWPSTPVSASWLSQEPEKLPEPEQIQPKEPREVMAQVSSEVSPSLPPPAQAVEAAAGAAKAFDPWPSTPDSPEQAEGAIQWPSVEVPPASDEAQEITQKQLEEPEKPQPIPPEVAPQVSSEVSPAPSLSPPAQAFSPSGAQENTFSNTFPVAQDTVADVEERAQLDTGAPIQWLEVHAEDMTWPGLPENAASEEVKANGAVSGFQENLESSTPFQWPGAPDPQVSAFSATASPSGASPNKDTAPSWPDSQAVDTAAGTAKAFDPWPSTPASTSWPSQDSEAFSSAIQWPGVEVPHPPEAQEIAPKQPQEPEKLPIPEKKQPFSHEVLPAQTPQTPTPTTSPPAQAPKVDEDEDVELPPWWPKGR